MKISIENGIVTGILDAEMFSASVYVPPRGGSGVPTRPPAKRCAYCLSTKKGDRCANCGATEDLK